MAFDKLIRDAQGFVGRQTGAAQTGTSDFGGLQTLPWEFNDPDEAFWKPLDIDPSRWDKLFPYRFVRLTQKLPLKISYLARKPKVTSSSSNKK